MLVPLAICVVGKPIKVAQNLLIIMVFSIIPSPDKTPFSWLGRATQPKLIYKDLLRGW